jgi:beta-xylosidase
MKYEKYICFCSLILFPFSSYTQRVNKPELIKLPFAFSQVNRTPMENTPVYFNSRLLLVANYRPGGAQAKGKDAYLYIDDLVTGEEVARFGNEHTFVSAYVNGSELHVFALDFSDFGKTIKSKKITHFVTKDLKHWTEETAIEPSGDESLFNTSVCKDDEGYLMAYESNKPVQFCFKFARSKDLKVWTKIPGIVYTGEHREYSACPMIRYLKPYYYVIYLHSKVKGHNGWISYLARSKDLADWELSPYNPVLEATDGEGMNNSDVDILEYKGRTYLYYGIGDQQTWSTIRVAMYDGSIRKFYESYFPEGKRFIKVSAKQ